MVKKLFQQLKNFDNHENAFGTEFIDAISYNESSDAFIVKAHEYPAVKLTKSNTFESNYYMLIHYLTDVKNQYMNAHTPHNETQFYHDWLIFKQNYNIRKAWFYLNIHNVDDQEEVSDLLIAILGKTNHHVVTALLNTPNEDLMHHATIAMNYVGNTRAVRDLCMKYLDPKRGIQWQFHLWHLMPYTIIDNYGFIFYLGNEMSKLEYCPYNYHAKECHYTDFYNYLNRKMLTNSRPQSMNIPNMREKMGGEFLDFSLLEDDCEDDDLELLDIDFDEDC